MFWTKEILDKVNTMYSEGFSYSEIGEAIGKSKSAVIGKMWRINPHSKYNKPVKKKIEPVKKKPVKKKPVKKPTKKIEIVPRELDTPVRTCQYPFGDKPYTFCDKKRVKGSYCQEHYDLCHIKKKDYVKSEENYGKNWFA